MTAPRAAAYDRTKRLLDVVVAGTALVASAPVQAVIAVLVARDLGRPVLFRQERPGKDGKPFTMVKFRSMKAAPEGTSPLHDAERLTRFGRLLRSTDGGRTWKALPTGIETDFQALFVDPETRQILIGGDEGLVGSSLDGGVSWHVTRIAMPSCAPVMLIGPSVKRAYMASSVSSSCQGSWWYPTSRPAPTSCANATAWPIVL